MPTELTMPAISPTMETGTLARWLVREGDAVKTGDVLAEIETDKATMEIEASGAGVIERLVVAEGTEEVPVGAVIALIGQAGQGEAPATAPRAPEPPPIAAPAPAPAAAPASKTPAPQPQPLTPPPSAGVKASPLARRIAAVQGIDLSHVIGSGPRGKIVKADIVAPEPAAATIAPPGAHAAPPAQTYPPPAGVPHEAIRLSAMRKTIARRMTEAKQTVPHIYLSVDVRLDALLALRGELNASLAGQGVKLSINDFLIKALAIALEQTPDANVQFAGDTLYRFARSDISMAVAVAGGLVTPVISDAANKRLTRIAAEAKDLAARARAGKLAPEEYQGGTATLSNLGMYGMKAMTAVINPPQALILGVGAGDERPYALNGELTVATVMTATGSFDHRAIDGAVGAEFMRAFKRLVEHPVELLA